MKSRTWFYRKARILNSSNFCIYCWEYLQEWEKVIDHFNPVCWWWTNQNSNLFVTCRECNSIKSNFYFQSISEARTFILNRKAEKWHRPNLRKDNYIELDDDIDQLDKLHVVTSTRGDWNIVIHNLCITNNNMIKFIINNTDMYRKLYNEYENIKLYSWFEYVIGIWHIDTVRAKAVKKIIKYHIFNISYSLAEIIFWIKRLNDYKFHHKKIGK